MHWNRCNTQLMRNIQIVSKREFCSFRKRMVKNIKNWIKNREKNWTSHRKKSPEKATWHIPTSRSLTAWSRIMKKTNRNTFQDFHLSFIYKAIFWPGLETRQSYKIANHQFQSYILRFVRAIFWHCQPEQIARDRFFIKMYVSMNHVKFWEFTKKTIKKSMSQ